MDLEGYYNGFFDAGSVTLLNCISLQFYFTLNTHNKKEYLDEWCCLNGKEYLLEEWDEEKNGIKPSQIEYKFPYEVCWKCENEHNWRRSIAARTLFDLGSPICNLIITNWYKVWLYNHHW